VNSSSRGLRVPVKPSSASQRTPPCENFFRFTYSWSLSRVWCEQLPRCASCTRLLLLSLFCCQIPVAGALQSGTARDCKTKEQNKHATRRNYARYTFCAIPGTALSHRFRALLTMPAAECMRYRCQPAELFNSCHSGHTARTAASVQSRPLDDHLRLQVQARRTPPAEEVAAPGTPRERSACLRERVSFEQAPHMQRYVPDTAHTNSLMSSTLQPCIRFTPSRSPL
jgi:hypothetical protein